MNDTLLQTLGLSPDLVATVVAISMVCAALGKLIPDTATGPLGWVRKVLKVGGLYVSNRVAPGESVSDVARSVINRTNRK